MKILIGGFNAKSGTEDNCKLRIGHESFHEASNDNGVRIVTFTTSKNLLVKEFNVPVPKRLQTCLGLSCWEDSQSD
jgi:hypothetical protein